MRCLLRMGLDFWILSMKNSRDEEMAIDVGLDLLNTIIKILRECYGFNDRDVELLMSNLEDMIDEGYEKEMEERYGKR